MSNGVIKTKEEAQDGKSEHSNGTIQEDNTNNIYSYRNQTLGDLRDGSAVTFNLQRDDNGNYWAYDIQGK